MKSFGHGFQRLPSEHSHDFYHTDQPAHSYQGATDVSFGATPTLTHNVPQFQYDRASNHSDERPASIWTSTPIFKILGFLSHLILTLMPIAFIVLAFLALSVDGDPMSRRGRVVYQAAKLGPSIFPIVFAAVVGRLMKYFALWRAERGSTIGLLEQLSGSQNLLAAVERTFLLSSFWGWGMVIVTLWLLSPLGGQSSLRVLEVKETGDQFNQQMYYFNTDDYNGTIFEGASSLDYGLPTVQAIFQACLLAPMSISSSSMDIWGNIKVPIIQAQPTYTGSSTQEWINAVHANDTAYSSLTGIVVSGLRSDATAQFNMETSYLNLTCPTPEVFGTGDINANFSAITAEFQDWMGDVLLHSNKSRDPFEHATGSGFDWNTFTLDTNFNFTSDPNRDRTPMNLIFASKNVDVLQITAYNCSLGLTHVESQVECNGTTCRVEKMRLSRQFTDPPVSTPWNQEDSFVQFYNFMNTFPWLSGSPHSAEVTPIDFYISGNNTPFQKPGIGGADYQNVSPSEVEQRLAAVLNTAWQSSIAKSSISSPPPDPSVFKSQNSISQPFAARPANSVMETTQTVYHANKLWVAFTAAISLILSVCGIAGMLFRYTTKAPDILGYVSTMTRDNPFFNDRRIAGADALDGLERARLLRDAVVQISDVRPWQRSGHIALRSVAANEDRRATRLKGGLRAPSPLATP